MKKLPIIYFIIPCYNEEECLPETIKCLRAKMHTLVGNNISKKSKLVLIDDGSLDNTWGIIKNSKNDIIGIKLSKNFGHQNALLAGMMYSKNYCDAIISLDADLQDDINILDKFIEKFSKEHYEIVYGVRKERKSDSFLKRNTAQFFYKIMNLLGANTIYNHADYRLVSKRVLEELSNFKEVNLFLRGIIPSIGFKTAIIEYAREERLAGKSKYSMRKMFNFAIDGITSFSIKPIRLVFALGALMLVVSSFILIYAVIIKLIGKAVSGWTFTICSIWIIGGIQMISLGIIGEYIGKSYSEVKSRPRYIIEDIKKS